MKLFDLLGKAAAVAEEIDERVEKAKAARDLGEAVVGRGVLTARLIARGVDLREELLDKAKEPEPPGILSTAESVLKFLEED